MGYFIPRPEESKKSLLIKVKGEEFNGDPRSIFSQAMVNFWNDLPEEKMEADTISTFTIHLNRYLERKDVKR